jgi:hypothetical protein
VFELLFITIAVIAAVNAGITSVSTAAFINVIVTVIYTFTI